MQRTVLIAVFGFVVVLTLANHARWTPTLAYALYPGIVVSSAAVSAWTQTLTRDKIGFAIEIVTNIALYLSVSKLILRIAAR